jgi:nitrate/nitrite transporter NarK
MIANKWLQLALGSAAWLLWLALYSSVRFAKRDVRMWKAPVSWAAIGAFAAWLGCWIADQREIERIFQLNFFGMYFAMHWLRQRYPDVTEPPFVTLNLSTRNNQDSRITIE